MWSDHVKSKSEKIPQEQDQWQERRQRRPAKAEVLQDPDDGNTPEQVDEQEEARKER